MYVADGDLHRILKFGMPISIISSEGTANGQFRYFHGLLLTQSQSFFMCDFSNHRIQVFKNDRFSHCFGQQGKDLITLIEDKLYVTDYSIQVFCAQGQFLKVSVCCGFTNVPTGYKIHVAVDTRWTLQAHT